MVYTEEAMQARLTRVDSAPRPRDGKNAELAALLGFHVQTENGWIHGKQTDLYVLCLPDGAPVSNYKDSAAYCWMQSPEFEFDVNYAVLIIQVMVRKGYAMSVNEPSFQVRFTKIGQAKCFGTATCESLSMAIQRAALSALRKDARTRKVSTP